MEPHSPLDITDDLLERYVAGHVSAAERIAVERALRHQPVGRRVIAALRRIWFTTPAADAVTLDDARVRRLIAERTGVLGDLPVVSSTTAGEAPLHSVARNGGGTPSMISVSRIAHHRGSGSSSVWLRRAAYGVATLALGIGVVRALWSVVDRSMPTTTRSYATGAGQRATVELVDGSRIVLAPRTTLTITSGSAGRTVSLVGEAHFDIVSNTHMPFIVRTGHVTTRVLGTTFEVRRYADDHLGRVLVLSGKVATAGHGTPVTLTAGMMGEFTDSSVVASGALDPATYTDWTRGQLVFRKVPVPVALATLTRWYGYQFRLGDSTLAADSVTAVFTIGETGEMMQRLQHLLSVSMTFDDSVVTLRPGRPGRQGADSAKPKSTPLHHPFSVSTEVGR